MGQPPARPDPRGGCSSMPSRSTGGRVPIARSAVDGGKDVLGLWMGVGGEDAKFQGVPVGRKYPGVRDVFFLVCDGIEGPQETVANGWTYTIVQPCIVHLVRNTLRFAARHHGDAIKRDIRPIHIAPNPMRQPSRWATATRNWGKTARNLFDESDRITERPLSAGDPRAWAFPHRASRDEVPVSCDPQPGPHRVGRVRGNDAYFGARESRSTACQCRTAVAFPPAASDSLWRAGERGRTFRTHGGIPGGKHTRFIRRGSAVRGGRRDPTARR